MGSQGAPPLEPPVVVARFTAEIFRDLGVREDEELLVTDPLERDLCNLLRLESGRGQEIEALPSLRGQHVGLHALRARAGDSDSLVRVRDREPFEEGQCRRFGHPVGGREHVVEKACGRYGAKDVAVLASEHPRQGVPRHVDVGHNVHVPDALPLGVGGLRSAADTYPGVRTEDVDASLCDVDLVDQLSHLCLARYVAADGHASDFTCHRPGTVRVDIGYDNGLRARGGEPSGEGPSDATSSARHHDDPVSYFHSDLWNGTATPFEMSVGSTGPRWPPYRSWHPSLPRTTPTAARGRLRSRVPHIRKVPRPKRLRIRETGREGAGGAGRLAPMPRCRGRSQSPRGA